MSEVPLQSTLKSWVNVVRNAGELPAVGVGRRECRKESILVPAYGRIQFNLKDRNEWPRS